VRKLQLPRTGGFPIWKEEHVAAYEMRWPVGTRQRVWLDVLLYTGLRRGDAVRLGRQHVKTGVATIVTEKTGTEVTIPILKVLADTLTAGPCGDLAFIVGPSGQPMTKESFGHAFHKACRAAGVPGSAHGLRKIAATRAANAVSLPRINTSRVTRLQYARKKIDVVAARLPFHFVGRNGSRSIGRS
jgi:integrase